MKYTKTAVAVGVAAGFALTPMMASAETTLSGIIEVKFTGIESDDDALQQDTNVAAGDVRVGVLSEHELGNGLIGYGNLQLNLDDLAGEGGPVLAGTDVNPSLSDDDLLDASATVSSDNVYTGIKGGFGDVRIGEVPVAIEYGQLANDIHDVSADLVDAISYTGAFGPVGIGVNYSPEPDTDLIGIGANFALAGFNIGLGYDNRGGGPDADEDADIDTFIVGASYAIAGFSLSAHYWTQGQIDFDETIGEDTDGDGEDDNTISFDSDLDDQTNIAVQAGYSIAGVALGLTYSVLDAEDGQVIGQGTDAELLVGDSEQTIIRFDAGYDLGGGTSISTRIQNKSTDADVGDDPEDELEYRVQLAKTF